MYFTGLKTSVSREVTQILFVFAVWAKLKQQKASERWQPDTEVSSERHSVSPLLCPWETLVPGCEQCPHTGAFS